jgi:hypothetical protein
MEERSLRLRLQNEQGWMMDLPLLDLVVEHRIQKSRKTKRRKIEESALNSRSASEVKMERIRRSSLKTVLHIEIRWMLSVALKLENLRSKK